MAHIENLNQENQEELSKLLSNMHENNPKLTWSFHTMNEQTTLKAEEANIDLEIMQFALIAPGIGSGPNRSMCGFTDTTSSSCWSRGSRPEIEAIVTETPALLTFQIRRYRLLSFA